MLGVAFKSVPLALVSSTVRVRRPPLLAKFWPPPISPDISEKVCPWVASLKFEGVCWFAHLYIVFNRRQALSAQSEGRDPNQTVVQRLVAGISLITSAGISPYFKAYKKISLDTWNLYRAEGRVDHSYESEVNVKSIRSGCISWPNLSLARPLPDNFSISEGTIRAIYHGQANPRVINQIPEGLFNDENKLGNLAADSRGTCCSALWSWSLSLDECLLATLSSSCIVRNEDQMGTKFPEWRPICLILIWTKYWTWVQGDICCAGSLGPYHMTLTLSSSCTVRNEDQMGTKFPEWRPICLIMIWTKKWTWVQGDICCAGSLGPYHTSLVQTCRDHLSRVKFIVVFQYLCSFFLSPKIYLRLSPCVRTLNTGWLGFSVHCRVNPGKSTFRNGAEKLQLEVK